MSAVQDHSRKLHYIMQLYIDMFSAISDSVQAFEYNLGLIKRLFWYKLTVTLVSYYYELLKTNAHTKKVNLYAR